MKNYLHRVSSIWKWKTKDWKIWFNGGVENYWLWKNKDYYHKGNSNQEFVFNSNIKGIILIYEEVMIN